MFSIIKKIASLDAKKLSTAHVGILQVYAYRALKSQTDEYLKEYDLISSQWAVLGMLHARPEGMQSNEIAHILGVKKPYVTAMTSKLLEKGLIKTVQSEDDKRAHFVHLTTKGEKIVPIIEKKLRSSMKGLVKGVSPRDLIGYMRVIKAISDNYKK